MGAVRSSHTPAQPSLVRVRVPWTTSRPRLSPSVKWTRRWERKKEELSFSSSSLAEKTGQNGKKSGEPFFKVEERFTRFSQVDSFCLLSSSLKIKSQLWSLSLVVKSAFYDQTSFVKAWNAQIFLDHHDLKVCSWYDNERRSAFSLPFSLLTCERSWPAFFSLISIDDACIKWVDTWQDRKKWFLVCRGHSKGLVLNHFLFEP